MKRLFRGFAAVVAVAIIGAGVFISAPPASAATGWSQQSVPTAVALNGVSFGSNKIGVAAGLSGQAFRTTDAGATWKALSTGSAESFFAAKTMAGLCGTQALPADCIWLGGTNGTILFSSDSGASWCPQATGTKETVLGLDSAGPNDIVAVGTKGLVLRSANGGTTASKCGAAGKYDMLASGTTMTLRDVDNNAGTSSYIAGDGGTILEVTLSATQADQANVNKVSVVASGTTANLYGVTVVGAQSSSSPNQIWVVGDGGLIRMGTDTYGPTNPTTSSFTAQPSSTTQTLRDVASDQSNILTFYAVGDLGTIVKSTDGGQTWALDSSPTCQNLRSVDFGYGPNAGDERSWASGDRATMVQNVANASATAPDCSKARTGGNGYRMVATDGGIFTFGQRGFHGSTGDKKLNKPIVGGATDQSTYETYWMVASDGGVFTFPPDGPFYGSLAGVALASPAVQIAPTPTGGGYWIVLASGKVYPFGDAKHYGDLTTMGINANQPIIGMSVTPSGFGYWLVGKDGGIFTFGDAQFMGSMGDKHLNAPVIDLAPTPDGQGYFLVAKDGGVFTFGTADFKGSTGDKKLNAPVVAMLVNPAGSGYWFAASDGGVFTFGAADFLGSMGATKLNAPVLDLMS
jgi:photosystem II stability/assembly factor-like uncharacterized protein